jgi:hypothetical protein
MFEVNNNIVKNCFSIFRMARNARGIKYANHNGGENHADDTTDQCYNKNAGMSQHGMPNTSSSEGIVRNNLMPSAALKDIEFRKPFMSKEQQYDSTSVENASGKILTSSCVIYYILSDEFMCVAVFFLCDKCI